MQRIITNPIVLLFMAVAISWAIKYEDCSTEPKKTQVLDVIVNRCEEKDRCPLIRGEITLLEITFKALTTLDNIFAEVSGDIGIGFLPFAGVVKKGCEVSGLPCPLEAGEEYTYNSTVSVKKYFPALEVMVKWRLVTGGGEVLCVLIPSVIE